MLYYAQICTKVIKTKTQWVRLCATVEWQGGHMTTSSRQIELALGLENRPEITVSWIRFVPTGHRESGMKIDPGVGYGVPVFDDERTRVGFAWANGYGPALSGLAGMKLWPKGVGASRPHDAPTDRELLVKWIEEYRCFAS